MSHKDKKENLETLFNEKIEADIKEESSKSSTKLNEEAKHENEMAEQDVAPEDTELGIAIKEAHKDQIINTDQVDANKAPKK